MKFEVAGKTITLTSEQVGAFEKLTKLQRGFACAYLAGNSVAESHRVAGGKARVESHRPKLGHEILNKPDVQKFIALFQSEAVEPLAKAVMNRDEMAERLTAIARTNLNDILDITNKTLFDENGDEVQQGSWALKDVENMSGAGVGMLSEMTVGKQGIKIKTHDQVAAMRQLADLMGWNKQQVEHTGAISVNVTPADIAAFKQAFNGEC